MLRTHRPTPAYGFTYFDQYRIPIPTFPALTHVCDVAFAPCTRLSSHAHEAFELTCIVDGGGWRACGDDVHRLGIGDVQLVRPGQRHHAEADKVSPFRYLALGFDASAFIPPDQDAVTLFAAASAIGNSVVRDAGCCASAMRALLAELERAHATTNPIDKALAVHLARAHAITALVTFARSALKISQCDSTQCNRISETAEWLRSRLAKPPSLREMAEHAGYSPSRFTILFQRVIGCTPLTFITRERVAAAARRLESSDMPVSEVARELGFATTRYFCTVFRRHTGQRATTFRRR
jgi:AraC-like DNA-binding protein